MQTGLRRGTKPIHETKLIKKIMVRTVSVKHRYFEPATFFWVGVYVRRQSSCFVTFDLLFI